jgi:hypothetical protein
MKHASIIAAIDHFYKLAGLLKVPEKLVKEVEEWTIGMYCLMLSRRLKDPFLRGYCDRLSKNITNNESKKSFMVNFTDLPQMKNRVIQENLRHPVIIDVELLFFNMDSKDIDKRIRGSWKQMFNMYAEPGKSSGTITIRQDLYKDMVNIQDIEDLKSKFEQMKNTVRHEIQHFVQDFISFLLRHREEAGLPGKDLRSPEYRSSGGKIPEFIGPYQDIQDEKDKYKRIMHPLRDIEFYTRLSDAISVFKRNKTHLPSELHHDFMLACVDHITVTQFAQKTEEVIKRQVYKRNNIDMTKYLSDHDSDIIVENILRSIDYRTIDTIHRISNFFYKLKTFQPLKYKKAVAEFIKAVG